MMRPMCQRLLGQSLRAAPRPLEGRPGAAAAGAPRGAARPAVL